MVQRFYLYGSKAFRTAGNSVMHQPLSVLAHLWVDDPAQLISHYIQRTASYPKFSNFVCSARSCSFSSSISLASALRGSLAAGVAAMKGENICIA